MDLWRFESTSGVVIDDEVLELELVYDVLIDGLVCDLLSKVYVCGGCGGGRRGGGGRGARGGRGK